MVCCSDKSVDLAVVAGSVVVVVVAQVQVVGMSLSLWMVG